jgi:hypothetical protein
MLLSPAQAGWQIDLNSPLRNSDQIDSVTSLRGVGPTGRRLWALREVKKPF